MIRARQTAGNKAGIRTTDLARITASPWIVSIAMLILPLTPVTAASPLRCDSGNPANWLSPLQMTERLTADGWSITGVVSANGCWKITGNTPEGARATGYFHPLSGEELLIKSSG